jgi:preprotein translocase subunit SecF
MEFFKPGRQFDFMRQRVFWIPLSIILVLVSIVLVFVPGPNYGTDFRGGTEVEVKFLQPIEAAQVRSTVESIGFQNPDVVLSGAQGENKFIIRVQEVTAVDEPTKLAIDEALCLTDDPSVPVPAEKAGRCSSDFRTTEVKFSLGGDKIFARFDKEPTLESLALVKKQLDTLAATNGSVRLRPSVPQCGEEGTAPCNPHVAHHRVEIQLQSTGDQLMQDLRKKLGDTVVPEVADRTEWVGPKAGQQLRDSARNAVAIAIVFIMLYLAFRFDLRFAPGVVIACIHDAMVVIGVFVALQKEITLSTIAAVLTIVGYSMNDTVVIYDRIRENLTKHRGKSFSQIINLSVSETLSRTILTSGATMLSIIPFFIWGTGVIKDFALAMVVGIVAGTYSSIYVAAPLTEWIDNRMAKKTPGKKRMSVSNRTPAKV